jgi:hypothetical protein
MRGAWRTNVRRVIVLILTAATLASLCVASAAALGGISGGQVGAGNAPIAACDSMGFTLAYTTVGGNVTAVTVSGIADPGCEGADLSLTLTNTGGASIASGGPDAIAPDDDTAENSVLLSVSPNPAAEQVSGYHISLVGP